MNWIEKVKELKENINNLNPEDRLQFYSAIQMIHNSIVASTIGWKSWIANPSLMNQFNKDELESIFNDLHKVMDLYLDIDIKWTETIKKKRGIIEKKIKKEPNYIR